MKKHFWQSRKFIYASGALVTAALTALLPQFVDMTPETAEAVQGLAIYAVIAGIALITGHTVTDVAAILAGAKANVPANVRDAVTELVDAVLTEDNTVSIAGTPLPETLNVEKREGPPQ